MELPKIKYPIVQIEVPSLKKKYKFHPFLVAEEKLLLMAKESGDESDILMAIKQVVNNCCLDNLDLDKLPIFDLEYLFLKLRAVSIDNVVRLSYIDREDNKQYNFEVNLDDVKVVFPEKTDNNIKITDTIGMVMKYPSAALYADKEFLSVTNNELYELILRCIDQIYEKDEVYDAKNFTLKQLDEFVSQLDSKTYKKVEEFLMNMPKISHKLEYVNALGNNRVINLESLTDFFTLR